jgi:HSP20 family protein
MLMRFDPFTELDRELDRLSQPLRSRGPVMPMDAYRRGDNFFVSLDLPGADPESVDLTVEKNVLTVRAERNWRPQEADEILVNERVQGAFTRQLFLGEGLDSDGIEAHYEHGVLSVTIPVAEKAKPRKVAVSTGATQAAVEAPSRDAGASSGGGQRSREAVSVA